MRINVKAAKDAAIREIEKYKDEAQYRPAQKQEFKDIVAEAKECIEKADYSDRKSVV